MVDSGYSRLLGPLLLTLVSACGGGGKSEQPAKPPTPSQPPRNSTPAPIPPAILARHDHDPFDRSILEAYNRQIEALKAEGQPYGGDFEAVPAEGSAGCAEDYFTFDGRYGFPAFMDGIQRPLIRAAQDPGNAMVKVYEGLYRAGSGPQHSWDIPSIRRASGFFYTGIKTPPATLAREGGLWCNLFFRAEGASLPHCVGEMDRKHPLGDAFNLSMYLWQTENGGFVSLTRSVNVARYFALNPGYRGFHVKEGYVYAVQASGGLDVSHPSLKKAWVRHEQEVAVPGLVPWSRVVAYRRFVRNPGTADHPAPPEFAGPIQVRAGLREKEPQAYARIVQDLSRKSMFTRDLEQGHDWRPKVKLGNSTEHVDRFFAAHPRMDPADPALW